MLACGLAALMAAGPRPKAWVAAAALLAAYLAADCCLNPATRASMWAGAGAACEAAASSAAGPFSCHTRVLGQLVLQRAALLLVALAAMQLLARAPWRRWQQQLAGRTQPEGAAAPRAGPWESGNWSDTLMSPWVAAAVLSHGAVAIHVAGGAWGGAGGAPGSCTARNACLDSEGPLVVLLLVSRGLPCSLWLTQPWRPSHDTRTCARRLCHLLATAAGGWHRGGCCIRAGPAQAGSSSAGAWSDETTGSRRLAAQCMHVWVGGCCTQVKQAAAAAAPH